MFSRTVLIHGGFTLRRLLSAEESELVFSYLEDRFGMKRELFSNFYFERTKRDIFMLPKEIQNNFEFEVEKLGLRALNGERHPPKPTSTFIQRFGHYSTKSRVEVDKEQFVKFTNGGVVEGITSELTNGYVIVTRLGIPIGVGFSRSGNLESQFPIKIGRSISHKYL